MSADSDQIQKSISLAKSTAETLSLSYSTKFNEDDRVHYIWLESELFYCEIFIFPDSGFVDFSILKGVEQLEPDRPFEKSWTLFEQTSAVMNFLERAVTENQV